MFRALALHQGESRDCGLYVGYIRSDEGLMLEMSGLESLYSGQFVFRYQLCLQTNHVVKDCYDS